MHQRHLVATRTIPWFKFRSGRKVAGLLTDGFASSRGVGFAYKMFFKQFDGMLNTVTTEEERIMMTNGTTSVWVTAATFIVGFAAGLGAGILTAPQSGARTRRHLHDLAHDLEEQTGHIVDDAKASLGRVIQHGKRLVV
jgi:hypothetical protein